MICLRCDCEEFDIKKDAIFKQEFKGKTLWVTTPGIICRSCGRQQIGNNQVDDLVKATKKVYESYKKEKSPHC